MDNAIIHKSKKVLDELWKSNLRVLYLPPYHPKMNPVEFCFRNLKGQFYRLTFTTRKVIDILILMRKSIRNFIEKKMKKMKKKIFKKYEKNGFGKETTIDIFNALCKERRDPRDSIPTPILKSDILKIEDKTFLFQCISFL